MTKKQPLILIAGPTAVGKTDLSIYLAKKLNTSIISADSMQIYKYMDIGSAKVTKEEMDGVSHYLVDEIDPKVDYSVALFNKKANEYISVIQSNKQIPLIVGGTGLYINSLIYEMDFNKTSSNTKLRCELEKMAKEFGNEYVHQKLFELDPNSANRIHPNNVQRVIRAIEIATESNGAMTDFKKDLKLNDNLEIILIVLTRDREHLYDRINKRVDIMIQNGLVDEVKKLLEMGYDENMTSMKGIGYKEIIKYLKGEYTLDDAIDIIKRDSRRYAKRQITWFKRYDFAKWFNLDEFSSSDEINCSILNYIEGKLKYL